MSAVLTGVGVALPWVTRTVGSPGHTQSTAGFAFAQGWMVLVAAALLAFVTVMAVAVRSGGPGWLALVPIGLGGLSLGNWLFNVAGCWLLNLPDGMGFPAGAGVSLIGMLLGIPGVAILYRGRLPGRLALVALALGVTVVALAAGVVRGPEEVCRTLV